MHRSPLILTLLASSPLTAQTTVPPRMVAPGRINGGLGGTLELADGTSQPFHIQVTGVQARLVAQCAPDDAVAGLAFGSAEEARLLQLLTAWADGAFPAEERVAAERGALRSPRSEAEDLAHRRASLLRTLASYRRVTRPVVDKVFAGRGTVAVSMQLRLGDDPPRQILWRQLGADRFARVHVGTEVEPVALDSSDEKEILLATRHWLAARLGAAKLVDEPPGANTAEDVRLVQAALRGYLEATSPRLRGIGTIMNGNPGGSLLCEISDAAGRVTALQFDHAAGSDTPGRLQDGGGPDAPVLEFGSPREQELLAMLRRAIAIRRGFLGEHADNDDHLRRLEPELVRYDELAKQAK